MKKTRGLTLVELLCAVALSCIIVGIVAGSSMQAQRAIESASRRQALIAQTRGFFTDLERDLARMVPAYPLPAPFDSDRPIAIANTTVTPPGGDPAGFTRKGDRIRLVTVTESGDRELVEYRLDGPNATSTSFRDAPGGGLAITNLRRHVLKRLKSGDTADKVVVQGSAVEGSVFVENVVSFEVRFLLAGDTSMIPPTAASSDGTLFSPEGDFNVANFTITPSAADGVELLKRVRTGTQLDIFVRGTTSVPTRYTIRGIIGDPPTNAVMGDRVILETTPPVKVRTVQPPTVLGVTLIVSFGKGPEGQTARFNRQVQVSR